MTKHITLPLTEDTIQDLKAGDSVLLSGTVITGRDARRVPLPAIAWTSSHRRCSTSG